MTTIADSISRVRNVLKSVKEDPFLTDRFIASVIMKYAKLLIKRQDDINKIMKFQSLFEVIPCLELIEVDKVEACCGGIKSNCIIKRTKDKLPTILESNFGPIIRSVTSIDGSTVLTRTQPTTYVSMEKTTNFRYNREKYYWYLEQYLYFPNIQWDAIKVEALWEGNMDIYKCDTPAGDCKIQQDNQLRIPEYLFAEVEQMTLKELLTLGQVPSDGPDDNQNILR
jgi:hypothetical protein